MVLVFVLAALFAACKHKIQTTAQLVSMEKNKSYYTCSMHPQVHEQQPGNCPICGMKLIKVEITGNSSTDMHKIILTAAQIQLAGIQTDTVREQSIGDEKTLTATVTTNENQALDLSARMAGRVEQLFVRTTGENITIGQPVYTIYSENLLEAEKEYLLAKQQQQLLHNPDVDYQQLLTAAENKLQLLGLSSSQIKSIATSGKVAATATILSKISGTVSDVTVHEGDYVTEGMPILKTQALNTLWVQAQLYAGETGNYKPGNPVTVILPDVNGLAIKSKVEFMNPELSDASDVALIRVAIPNRQGLIRPGMLAYISIPSAGKRFLAVPASAIITDGNGNKVWVKNTDGSFSSRQIKQGGGNQSYVAVISGLNHGDMVVTNGAYLLNSEAYFRNGGVL